MLDIRHERRGINGAARHQPRGLDARERAAIRLTRSPG